MSEAPEPKLNASDSHEPLPHDEELKYETLHEGDAHEGESQDDLAESAARTGGAPHLLEPEDDGPPGKASGAKGKTRRDARKLAMLAVFGMEHTGYDLSTTLQLGKDFVPEFELFPPFSLQLVEALGQHRESIQQNITTILENWDFSRVGMVERTILLLAFCEIAHFPDIPPRVTVNEYLELAKKFANDKAFRLINGVVDKFIQKTGKTDFQSGRVR